MLANQVFGFVGAGDAAEDIARFAFTHIQRQAQQLDRAFDSFAIDDFGDAQVDLGEVVDGDGLGDRLAAGERAIGVRAIGVRARIFFLKIGFTSF